MLSSRTLANIKFHSPETHLLAWLKKAKVFIKSDTLGTEQPTTVGYFTKIDPTIMHLANFREHLINQLMLIEIDAKTVIDLAPHLKQQQLKAMSNGDEFTTILLPFELYKSRISHGPTRRKLLQKLSASRASQRMPSFWKNSLREWHQNSVMTQGTEFFCRKEPFTFWEWKHMLKFLTTTTFS